jgi:signal transduction histidine kinase
VSWALVEARVDGVTTSDRKGTGKMLSGSTIEPQSDAHRRGETPELGVGAGGRGWLPAERRRRFVVQVSHEMRTPLAALRLELEEALTNRDVADPFAALKEALQSVERLENTVIALLWLLQRDASERP